MNNKNKNILIKYMIFGIKIFLLYLQKKVEIYKKYYYMLIN